MGLLRRLHPVLHARAHKRSRYPTRLLWETGVLGGIVFANADADRLFWLDSENSAAGPFAANAPATRVVGGSRFIQVEGSRTNQVLESERLDQSPWSLLNSATITANTHNGPSGEAGADRLNHAAHSLSAVQQGFAGLMGDSRDYMMSVFHRSESATEDWRLQTINKVGAGASIGHTATTSWQRADYAANTGTGATTPTIRIRNDGDALARAVVHATPQWEGGVSTDVFFPSSPIRTGSTSKTRPADLAYTDKPPSFLVRGRYDVVVVPYWSTTDLQTSEVHYLLYQDASNHLSVYNDAGTVKLRLATSGGTIERSFTETSRQTSLTFTIDFIGGDITVAGATTGNGTTSGTVGNWALNSRVYIGSTAAGASHLDGAISEPVAVAA